MDDSIILFKRLMSDCEEANFFWESWTSPGKKKRKKEPKKNNKVQNGKNNTTMKTNESIQKKKKKKKNSKFKEAMEERKDKKKEKKKKKKKPAQDLDDSFVFPCDSSAAAPTAPTQAKPEASNLRSSTEKLKSDQPTQDSKKKTKRKKKVMFDLSPGYIRVKRPKVVSSSAQSPTESIIWDSEAVRDGEKCSQLHDNDSQCTGDDMNSQDLFITQKTFRGSPSDPSSGEASDKAVITTTTTTSTASTSTQTENFFSTELSSYLDFCQKSTSTVNSEDLKPLDLRLPQKMRKDLRSCLSAKTSATELKDDEEKFGDHQKPLCLVKENKRESGAQASCSSQWKKELCGGQLCSVRAESKGETSPSPQSADTTTSSEDNEPLCRSIKMDLTQVRAVQMRLNESFFFKTKGEGQSPRPESPLMKLAQGRDVKSRKGR
ncbi:hypothetical protein PAMP_019330 [Pampus punctatissimus]